MRWTKEQDAFIIKALSENNLNKHVSFYKAKEALKEKLNIEVTTSSISSRYYRNEKEFIDKAKELMYLKMEEEYKKIEKDTIKEPWYKKAYSAVINMMFFNNLK